MSASADSSPALRLDGVTRTFRADGRVIVAVNDVSAQAQRGAITGLIGPDAAGKTTLMRLCTGLLRPDQGRIEVLGVDVGRDPDAARARAGYMPQRFGLYEDLSVRENLDLYARIQGVPVAQRSARYDDLLHMTGLRPFLGRLAGRLSGGMKQKLGLACALIRIPEMLFLDEPTVGVDPVARRELWEIVDHLIHTQGMTVLLSTSYLDEAERCARVLLLHEGRLVGAADPADFTAPLRGRSFFVSAEGIGKRRLHERLASAPGVLDATIQGAQVRIVMQAGVAVSAAALLPDAAQARIVAVAPRFEDSFVAILKSRAAAAASLPVPPSGPAMPASSRSAAAPVDAASGETRADEVVIVADRLTRRFGDFVAVDEVSFTVRRGEIFGLLGANGAGKSTTFRMLCGLLPPSEGTLQVAGFDLRQAMASARGRVGYMAQKFSLYGDLSVLQNLRFFSSAYRLQGPHRQARIAWALEDFGLGPMADAISRELPLGYQRRLALACALMHEPEILFLDEPTSGVDPLARREFWHRINSLAETGVTALVTTHFMEEAEYCDRLVILAQGRVLAAGDSESLKARARSPEHPDPTMEQAFIALLQAASPASAA